MNPTMYPSHPSAIPTLMARGMPATHCIVKKYRLKAGHMLAERKPSSVDADRVDAAVVAVLKAG